MNLKNKKVLVTGACGFIGSHLVERLIEEGCSVRAFVFYNSFNSWGWLDYLTKDKLKKIDIFAADIRDPRMVDNAVSKIDIVFHLAALIGIPFSYSAVDSYVDTNVCGTLNILQASQKRAVERIIITSTSEVYGTARYVPIDEKHPLQGQSPYSATKISADYLAESFYRSFGLPVTIARPFNTYGPRQSARAIIPTIILQLLSGRPQIGLGSLHPIRDFVFIKDTVEGLVEIAKSDKTIGEIINIATQKEISIERLSHILIDMINPTAKIIKDTPRVRPKKSEIGRLLGSNDKIKKLTGWKPKYTLERGLEETVDWFRQNRHLRFYKPELYNV